MLDDDFDRDFAVPDDEINELVEQFFREGY